ncbi:MAG: RES family NAD+ phosphorylase [Arenicella sp.]
MNQLKAYRITHKDYRQSAFNGEGARIHGGRWNDKGSPVVYLASHPALAVLEILVHINDETELKNFCLFELDLPEEQIFVLEDEMLPANWNEYPAPSSTVNLGQEWINSKVSLAMRVPSVTIPYHSYNYVLNVQYESFHEVVKQAIEVPIELDPRLL